MNSKILLVVQNSINAIKTDIIKSDKRKTTTAIVSNTKGTNEKRKEYELTNYHSSLNRIRSEFTDVISGTKFN